LFILAKAGMTTPVASGRLAVRSSIFPVRARPRTAVIVSWPRYQRAESGSTTRVNDNE